MSRALLKANRDALKRAVPAQAERYLRVLRNRALQTRLVCDAHQYLVYLKPDQPIQWNTAYPAQDASNKRLIICLGFGTGEYLQQLLSSVHKDTLFIVVEPFPEVLGEILTFLNYADLLSDPRFKLFIGTPAEFEQTLMSLPAEKLALDQSLLLLHPPTWEQLKKEKHPFYPVFKELQKQFQRVNAFATREGRMTRLESYYRQLEQQAEQIREHYPFLSCQAGCADCCKGSPGSIIFISPIEWERIFYTITEEMPEKQRRLLFWKTLLFVDSHLDDMIQYQQYLNTHTLKLFSDESDDRELFMLSAQIGLSVCPFLNSFNQCTVYQARPMVCRIFGYSYWGVKRKEKDPLTAELKVVENRKPYTCHMDNEKIKAIVQDKNTVLFEAGQQFYQTAQLHGSYAKGNILPNWLALHLDMESGDFVSTPKLKIDDFHDFIRSKNIECLKSRVSEYIQIQHLEMAEHQNQLDFFLGKWFSHDS